MKGNDRLARRLHSMTLTSLSLQMNWMLKGPEIRKALPQARHSSKNNGRVKLPCNQHEVEAKRCVSVCVCVRVSIKIYV